MWHQSTYAKQKDNSIRINFYSAYIDADRFNCYFEFCLRTK